MGLRVEDIRDTDEGLTVEANSSVAVCFEQTSLNASATSNRGKQRREGKVAFSLFLLRQLRASLLIDHCDL